MTDLATRLRALADDLTGPSSAWAQTDVIADALSAAADEIARLRLGLAIIASDPHPCIHAIQSTAQRYLDGGEP